jgi:flagellar biosynthesis GTPase FlhF
MRDESRTDTPITDSVRTFHGPDLEALLSEVRREMGSGARIVSATKERSGGVGGFFSKERYSVIAHAAPAVAVPVVE